MLPRDGACAEGKSAMNRREFTTRTVAAAVALAFAGAARVAPERAAAGFEPSCHGCGGRIWRGSRAYLLEQFGDDPRLNYCVSCLAAAEEGERDVLTVDDLLGEPSPLALLSMPPRSWWRVSEPASDPANSAP